MQFHEINFEQINLTGPMCAFQDDSNCEQEAAWFVDLYSLPRDQVVKKPKINWPKTVIDKKRGLNYVQSICFIRYRMYSNLLVDARNQNANTYSIGRHK